MGQAGVVVFTAEIVAVPASDVVDGAGLSNGQVSKGIVAFTGPSDTVTWAPHGAWETR